MKSFLVLALGLLGVVDIVALEGSNSDQASSSSSGSGAVDDGATVGDSAIAVYLPTKVLQNQLLNATGMEPDSLVAVTSSYSVLQDGSPGLADIATPNTNVFTSVLIVPAISNNSEAAITSILETKSSDDLSGRTQLMYNCKSAANLWNLLEDPNVLTLEGFQLFDTDASEDDAGSDGSTWADAGAGASTASNSSSVTEIPREIVALALVKVANCSTVLDLSSERAVLGNSFFGAEFFNSSTYFYVLNSIIQDVADPTSATESCLLKLEMARATLIEVYPNCKIKFQSTDLNNLLDSATTTTLDAAPQTTRRLASTFGFLKDPSCTYACGKGGAPTDQCLASNGKGGWVNMQCTIEFYQRGVGCGYECGDETGSPYNQAEPNANQCYDCYKTTSACKSGYYSVSGVGCCQKLTCPVVSDTSMLSPSMLTWNLEADGRTISNPAFPIYNNGRCSDAASPSTSCCLITCTNCYTSITIASLYVDLDTYPDTKKYSTTSEMQLAGTSEMKLKIFAPNGCVVDNKENVVSFTRTTSLSSGIDLELKFTLDIL
ncbi:hypothetical protein PR002_g28490 [Phytophthora rubi]|uniref:FAS1 domain-containing protein n=1 Tax=Phytophthora rubi TaxID=129364 RepID=A0A6A3HAA5_9STRA|nr:hypothetical protein PR002_g28490 [Phytophthora rubi]